MQGWSNIPLDEITCKIGSGATPRGGSNAYKATDISLIRSQNILDYHFSINGLAFIGEEQAARLKNVIVEKNDVLLNITGDSVARCCLVDEKILPARVNQHVAIIRADENKAYCYYILYSLLNMKEELLSQSEIGATRRALTKGMLESLEISCPSLLEQKAIAGVLSVLDDKIDLLHRQNKTLEALAETLFRQWFIEEAQDDWDEAHVYDFARHVKVTVKPNNNTKVLYAHYSLPAFDNNKRPTMELGGNIKSNKYGVPNNSVLISKLNPITPRIWPIADNANGKAICSTEFQVAQPVKGNYFCFVYYLLKSQPLKNILQAAASGTSGSHQRVKPSDIFDFSFQRPPEYKITNFAEMITPQLDKVFSNQKQIQTLENLRDTLLPKLMSGAVRVRYDEAA